MKNSVTVDVFCCFVAFLFRLPLLRAIICLSEVARDQTWTAVSLVSSLSVHVLSNTVSISYHRLSLCSCSCKTVPFICTHIYIYRHTCADTVWYKDAFPRCYRWITETCVEILLLAHDTERRTCQNCKHHQVSHEHVWEHMNYSK